MGIAEIQAAFAANAAQPSVAANPFGAPPAPAPFAPPPVSPAAATQAAFAFAAAAPVPAPSPFGVHAPAPAPFAFTPPAGFAPSGAPPINPVGERASLNTAAPVVEAPAAPVEPVVEAKPRRQRKPRAGATNAGDAAIPAEVLERAERLGPVVNGDTGERGGDVPLDALTTEQLVQFLVDRGYAVRLERAG